MFFMEGFLHLLITKQVPPPLIGRVAVAHMMVSVGLNRFHNFNLSTTTCVIYVEVSRNAYMKLDEIEKLNHPILDLNDVFCVQGD